DRTVTGVQTCALPIYGVLVKDAIVVAPLKDHVLGTAHRPHHQVVRDHGPSGLVSGRLESGELGEADFAGLVGESDLEQWRTGCRSEERRVGKEWRAAR